MDSTIIQSTKLPATYYIFVVTVGWPSGWSRCTAGQNIVRQIDPQRWSTYHRWIY